MLWQAEDLLPLETQPPVAAVKQRCPICHAFNVVQQNNNHMTCELLLCLFVSIKLRQLVAFVADAIKHQLHDSSGTQQACSSTCLTFTHLPALSAVQEIFGG